MPREARNCCQWLFTNGSILAVLSTESELNNTVQAKETLYEHF
jgi:hypothetical protein